MDNVEKEIEFGILSNKVIRWVEPDFVIPGCVVERSVRFNYLIKWHKKQRKLFNLQSNTYEYLEDTLIVNWAWITDD